MKFPAYALDAGRLAALDGYKVLDTAPETGFDDIAALAAHICETPVALVSLVAVDRQWFKGRVGFDGCETDLGSSVCVHALVEPDLLVIPDLTEDPRTRDNPLVVGDPRIRFYAGAPLRTPEGHVIGSLCAIDVLPRPVGLADKQADMLRALARQVMTQMETRRLGMELERRMAQQASDAALLETSRADFRFLFDGIDDGFCVVEMKFDGARPVDYRFVEVNPAFVHQTGLGDAKGRWMREIAPDHEQHWFDIYGKVALTGEPVRFENEARQLGERWYEVHAFRVSDPALGHVGILFNDVSKRKSEERLRREIEVLQETINREISHRLKNSFAMVLAIAGQTLRTVTEQEAVAAFNRRIHALSRAHDLLIEQNWVAAEIEGVVRTVFDALAPRERLDIGGPALKLGARATLSVSLLLHELTANALKHGSQSNDGGRVSLVWRVQDDGGGETGLILDWRESGGPPVRETGRKGFGSRLIKQGILGTGGADIRYESSGFAATFNAPLAQVQQS